jgi:hypothetical protein
MYHTPLRTRNIAFFVLLSLFAFFGALLGFGGHVNWFPTAGLAALAIAFAFSGLVVVLLTARLHEARTEKAFFLLAGASGAAIPICALLHNVVYGLVIWWFGNGFWEAHGSDEPVFFILALVVFPAVFLVSAIGCFVFLIKGSPNQDHPAALYR